MADPSSGLVELRAEIDRVDRALLEALARRRDVVKRIRDLKRAGDLPPLDPGREQAVRARWLAHAEELGIPGDAALAILEDVLRDSRELVR